MAQWISRWSTEPDILGSIPSGVVCPFFSFLLLSCFLGVFYGVVFSLSWVCLQLCCMPVFTCLVFYRVTVRTSLHSYKPSNLTYRHVQLTVTGLHKLFSVCVPPFFGFPFYLFFFCSPCRVVVFVFTSLVFYQVTICPSLHSYKRSDLTYRHI